MARKKRSGMIVRIRAIPAPYLNDSPLLSYLFWVAFLMVGGLFFLFAGIQPWLFLVFVIGGMCIVVPLAVREELRWTKDDVSMKKKQLGKFGKTKAGVQRFMDGMKLLEQFMTAPDETTAQEAIDKLWAYRKTVWSEIGDKLAQQPEQEVAHAE